MMMREPTTVTHQPPQMPQPGYGAPQPPYPGAPVPPQNGSTPPTGLPGYEGAARASLRSLHLRLLRSAAPD